MKLLLFSGSHSRHLFVNKKILDFFDESLVIVMERESVFPLPPDQITSRDKDLFKKHFSLRKITEEKYFGDLDAKKIFAKNQTIYIKPEDLNTENMANIVEEFNADFCFIFGPDLILDPVIEKLPENKINLHLGLSPWYKGSATLFFPFFMLQPQFCGCTFHQIIRQPDAGEIVHQCVPKLNYGDKLHDVAAKCVVKASEDLPKLISFWLERKKFPARTQHTSGKNWRGVDFNPAQLRLIYELYNDEIVDRYLDGELGQK